VIASLPLAAIPSAAKSAPRDGATM